MTVPCYLGTDCDQMTRSGAACCPRGKMWTAMGEQE